MNELQAIARRLDNAAANAQSVAQFDPKGELPLSEAYAIQAASIALRLVRGERRVGVKMGFTSRAKMVQMGLQDVIWGRLTDAMAIEDGSCADFGSYVHPRVEPELAFVLKKTIHGKETAAEALAAVEAIAPALEIIDSRFTDFKFSLPEVVADNASSSGFVVGGWHDPHVDFSNLGLVMTIDGRVSQVGSSAAILGHPLRSLVAAARLASDAGEPLQAGWIVMAGGATPAEWIFPGQYVELEMQDLGRVGFQMQGLRQKAT